MHQPPVSSSPGAVPGSGTTAGAPGAAPSTSAIQRPLTDSRATFASSNPPEQDWRSKQIVSEVHDSRYEIASGNVAKEMMEALKALISKKRLPPLANSQDMPGSRTYPSLCPSEKTPELYIFENTRDQLIGKIVTTSVVGGVVVAGALWAGAAGIGGQNLFWGSVVQALPGIVSALFAGAVVNNVIKIDQHFENSVMKAYRMAKNAGMDWARMVAWNSVTYNLLETWNPLQVRPNQTSFLDATPDRSMAQVKAHIREAAAYAFNELQKSASIPAAQRASPGMRDPVHDQRLEMIAGHLADYKNRTMSVPQWLAVPGMVGGLVCVLKSVADVIHFIDKF